MEQQKRRLRDPHDRMGLSQGGRTHRDDGSPLPRLLDVTMLADHLGVNSRHVRRLIAERRIPYLKWGRLIRFDPAEVADWLEASRVRVPGAGD
jgi:excisionase family DNA binding protein